MQIDTDNITNIVFLYFFVPWSYWPYLEFNRKIIVHINISSLVKVMITKPAFGGQQQMINDH